MLGNSATAGGATQISASATIDGVSVTTTPYTLSVTPQSTSASTATLTATLSNLAGTQTTALVHGTPLRVKARLLDGAGNPLKNVVVAMSSLDTSLAVVAQNSALTDASGDAFTNVNGASSTAVGASYININATVAGKSVSASVPFSIGSLPTAQPTLSMVIKNLAGAQVFSVDTLSGVTAYATAIGADGSPKANIPVSFVVDNGYLTLTPSTGTASTLSSGTASLSIQGNPQTAGGATQVSATATIDGQSVTATPYTLSVTGQQGNVSTPTLSTILVDNAGVKTTSLSFGSPVRIKATLKDGAGNPVPDAIVALTSADTALAVVGQASALTDATGVAYASVDGASLSAVGASYINVSATVSGKTVTASAPFQVGAATVGLTLSQSTASISAYGTASLSATVTVNGVTPAAPMSVNFSSGCSIGGKASLGTGVQTVNGVATTTYTDNGCGASDTITVSVNNVTKTTTVTSAAPQAANVQFTGVSPTNLLVLKGTGGSGYFETATVSFKVVDTANKAVPNRKLRFNLTTSTGISTGGVLLDNTSTAVEKLTDVSGVASVSVQTGDLPVSVWVVAELCNASTDSAAPCTLSGLSTRSNQLVISTGTPTQDRFSLAASVFNIEGFDIDGTKTTLSVTAADRLGNLVPNGTTINFVSEAGLLRGDPASTCIVADGHCSVTFESTGVRPTDGRVSAIAYTLGEESFVDLNGNNKWDTGETFEQLGDVIVDENETSTRVSPQNLASGQSIRFNSASPNTGTCDTPAAKNWNAPSKISTCDATWGRAHVRRNIVIVWSHSTARLISTSQTLAMGSSCSKNFTVQLDDTNNNALPAGTVLALASNSALVKPPAVAAKTPTLAISPSAVADTTAAGATVHTLSIASGIGSSDCVGPVWEGGFALTATTPSGRVTTFPFTVGN